MQVLESKPYSSHPEDKHLVVISVHLGDSRTTPWVTWIRNRKTGANFWGHYFRTCQEMVNDFQERGVTQ